MVREIETVDAMAVAMTWNHKFACVFIAESQWETNHIIHY